MTSNLTKRYIDHIVILLLIVTQYFFWQGIDLHINEQGNKLWEGSNKIQPNMEIIDSPPTRETVQAISLGDEEFYFRVKSLQVQNSGDTFGRTTALISYDYDILYKWWALLDSINPQSTYLPPLVSYYFGASKLYKKHTPLVIKFLVEYADRDPVKRWWWYSQAIYHARHKLKNLELALEIANKMSRIPLSKGVPMWVYQMPAFILEAKGEYSAACNVIAGIINNKDEIAESELNFMLHFIQSRVREMAMQDPNSEQLKKLTPQCQYIIDLERNEMRRLKREKLQ